ncbi:MAG TPA: hypothetical protein VIS72_13000, partial [Anaerolineales bacterium]
INLERENIGTDAFNSFLLSQALTYGYKDDHWWSAVSDPRARLWVSSILLRKGNDAIAERVVGHLVGDMEILAFSDKLPEDISESLLEIGAKTYNMVLRRQILDGIRELTQPGKRWSDKALSLSISQIEHLGELALEDSDAGDAAAALIGHLRAIPAVQVVLNHHDDRRIAALLLIQRVAESLPANVQGNIRFRVSLEWILQRLIQQPVSLIGAYMTAFLGAALGVGMQVYQTYNLPDFLDIARFTTSLEQGLIVGAVFGLGVFLIRVVAERFRTADILLRVVFGTIFGGLGMNIALLVFHVLFLNTPPRGLLITGGCMIIALAFVTGSLTHSYLFKVLLSSVSILAAITGTWWIHVNNAGSPMELAPLFRYDYAWSLTRVSFTALLVALPIGILGNMVNLAVVDE